MENDEYRIMRLQKMYRDSKAYKAEMTTTVFRALFPLEIIMDWPSAYQKIKEAGYEWDSAQGYWIKASDSAE